MKILIIGGCGVQAKPGLEMLLSSQEIDEVVIGDIDLEAANKLVDELQNSNLSAIKVDAFDHRGMVTAMQGSDIIFNCSGPYHLLGVRVLKASIEAGKHYVDYCDDVTPTIEMLALTEAAKQKGVTAIVGLGVSPGYFNLLAKKAADQLDTTEEINMYWSISKGEPEGPAVIDHMCDIFSGDVIQFLDGKETKVPALSGFEEEVQMPEPFGKMPTVYVGHPEPVILGRSIPGLKQVINKYATSMDEIGFFTGLRDLGLMAKEPISIKGNEVVPRDVLVHLLYSAPHEELPEEERKKCSSC